ncbi:glucose-methanol-choline oxidoreductase isoform B [Micractinium conductrix]|uniref:Glucose-methanol-choline oxidoreductase isoform A n=1 Tax=Micractinium conductrix TaxID=554055 RepID=A0A2P6VHV1_9CHLO|nr:glucose-methanol-choline oxidoreductase isoform A [Micractinium conductrix]PSC73663.1 glucose-methanol-choline oxidoreductase isoform B [Micractinium conductrix]|eukprot:PSC73662.1 glucose-methanol-choline oxidoreductase isoform A [Micractinium conductrix]
MADEAAVLPWGSSQQEVAADVDDAGPPAVPDLPAAIGLELKSRLEIKWELHQESGETSTKWWGAELHRREEGRTDGEGRQCYMLRYDPEPEQGCDEAEECLVTFLEEHFLYDLAQDAELAWRAAGSDWDEPEDADGEAGDGTVSMAEVAASIRQGERRRGRTLDEDAAEMLSALPMQQQMHIASSYALFSETLAAALARLTAHNGPEYVVTEADVKAAIAEAKAAQRSGGA